MKKLFLFIILLIPFNIYALDYPELYSDKVLVYDITDSKELYELNSKEKTSIASITKILTVYTAIKHSSNINEKVTITNNMLKDIPNELYVEGLKKGDVLTEKDLMYIAITSSGADACYALAYHEAGSIPKFVSWMNQEAKELGMNNSHFENVHGLDQNNHYSSAEDIYKLIIQARKNKDFKEIFSSKGYTTTNQMIIKSRYINIVNNNVNKAMITGGKTGYTNKAGVCFAGTFISDKHEFIIVLLNAPYVYGKNYNIQDFSKLIKFIDDNYNWYNLYNKGQVIKTLKVNLSKTDNYNIIVSKDITKFLPKDYDKSKITFNYESYKDLSYRTKKGSKIGHIKYNYDKETIYEEDIILNEDLKISIKKVLNYYKIQIICLFIILILIILLSKRKRKLRKKYTRRKQ